jgi:hypothetical protein
MQFAFEPTAAGELTDASIGTWNGVPFNILLKGTGIGPKLLISPVGFDFGVVKVGTTSPPLTTNVTNVGISPIVMSGTGGAPPSPFGSAQDCQGATLNPGQTCHMSYGFAPTAIGSFTGTSIGTWNGQSFNVALRGMGQTVTTFTGFLGALDAFPNFRKATAGQSIPVKFSLGDDFGLNIFVTGSPASGPVVCGSPDEIAATEPTSTAGGSALSYDPLTTMYTYAWKTNPAWAGTCRQLVVVVFDGTTKRANVQFK